MDTQKKLVTDKPFEDDENFDPMKEDFHSNDFNSYLRGPGSYIKPSMHTDSRRKQEGGLIKLHITNIPANMNDTGIKNIFSKMGEIQSTYIAPVKTNAKTKWGFIEYKTLREANKAVYEVNNVEPHCITVKFALSENQKAARKRYHDPPSSDKNIKLHEPSLSRGRGILPGLQGTPPQQHKSTRQPYQMYNTDTKDTYVSGEFQHYNGESSSDITNDVLKNCVMSVSQDGTRKVFKGRGTSIVKGTWNMKPRSMNTDHINKYVYFTSKIDDKYYFKDDDTLDIQPPSQCSVCDKMARRKCYNCKLPYCSKKCAYADWPNHKDICISKETETKFCLIQSPKENGELRAEESKNKDSSSCEVSDNSRNTHNRKVGKDLSKNEKNGPRKSLPKEEYNFEKSSNNEPSVTDKNQFLKTNKTISNRNINSMKPTFIRKVTIEKPESLNVTEPVNSTDSNKPDEKEKCCENIESNKKTTQVPPKCPIPLNTFTSVRISFIHDETYWVINSANMEVQLNMHSQLNSYCADPEAARIPNPQAARIPNPQPQNKCAAKYESHWYRAKILQVNSSIHVKFVDFGNEEVVSLDDIRALPLDLSKIPPLAFCVHLAEGTSKKYYKMNEQDTFNIKPICKVGEVWTVQVEGESYPEPVTNKSPKPVTTPSLTSSQLRKEEILQSPSQPTSQSLSEHSTQVSSPSSSTKPPPVSASEFISFSSRNHNKSSLKSPQVQEAPPVEFQQKSPVSKIPDNSPLPADCFTMVCISHPEQSNIYWVNIKSSLWELLQLSESLEECVEQKVNPVLGEIYVKEYSDVWCRAKVVSLDPLKVFYIDFGNEEEVTADDLRTIHPTHYNTPPPFAFKIKLAEGTGRIYYDLDSGDLSVKPLYVQRDGTYVVAVEGETYLNLPVEEPCQFAPKKTVKHLLSLTNTGDQGIELIVNKIYSDDHITCSLVSRGNKNYRSVKQIEKELHRLNPIFVEKPTLGDVVCCVTKSGVRARGYIMSLQPNETRVALIDYADVLPAEKLCPMPNHLEAIPEIGVRVILSKPTETLKKGSILQCSNVKRRDNEVLVKVDRFGTCTLSVWEPRVEEGGLSAVIVPSGSKVCLSAYQSPQAVYIQSLTAKDREKLNTTLQDVAMYARKAPSLDRKPLAGEIVACIYSEDNNYYRAQIFKRREDKYLVTFLDFGNTAEVSVSDMKVLDDSLKMIPCCSVKVGLKGVKTTALTPDAITFLNDLIAEQTELFIEYDDNDLSNSKIESKDGLSLNNKISDMIDPNWKKCLENGKDPTGGEVFMADMLKYIPWDIGTLVDLVVIKSLGHNAFLALDTADGFLEFISSQFTRHITEYCETFVSNFSYNPRVNELCLAKYKEDNLWYRAVCLKNFKASCEVIFVDFGNNGELHHRDIRPLTAEFLKTPVILKKCTIFGVPDKVSETSKEKLLQMFSIDSKHKAIVTEESNKGSVVVYIPSLTNVTKDIGIPKITPPTDP